MESKEFQKQNNIWKMHKPFAKKSASGITLVALVVTIIVLIILAGISINLILGDDGIITKANEAKLLQEKTEIKENAKLEIVAKEIANKGTITQSEIEDVLKEYGTVNKNDDGTIKSLTPENKDYEIPFEEIYIGKIESNAPTIPEKSEEPEFSRAYGVIEIEFLEGTTYKTTTTPNAPNMASNMKKVYWKDDGTEVLEGSAGFDETKWYSYEAQTEATASGGTSKWANAVTVNASGDITGYFVWIPRYAYRIVYFDTQTHENAYRLTGATDGIIGYSDSRGFVHPDGKTPSNMETPVTSVAVGTNKLRPHPAFENGSATKYTQGEWETALEGIWISKYDMSGSLENMQCLPGKQPIEDSIGDSYENALKFNEDNKSHILKNSEWGAMTYLTDSKYGRNGTDVKINDYEYTAGQSGATVKSNPLQSTTGNYYGIYDVTRDEGLYEYVAGYIASGTSNNGNSFASTDNTYNNKTTSTPYATVYDMLSADATYTENYNLNINRKFGDALIETSISDYFLGSWGGDYSPSKFANGSYPFFGRASRGIGNNKSLQSIFSFEGNKGEYGVFHIAMCVM